MKTSCTPVVTVGAYSALDAVGGLLTFTNCYKRGFITSLVITDAAKQSVALELWLFDRTWTVQADNAAFAVSDADLLNCVGVIPIATTDYCAGSDNSIASVRNVGMDYELLGTSLYGQLKAVGTPTYAAVGDVTVKLSIEKMDD